MVKRLLVWFLEFFIRLGRFFKCWILKPFKPFDSFDIWK